MKRLILDEPAANRYYHQIEQLALALADATPNEFKELYDEGWLEEHRSGVQLLVGRNGVLLRPQRTWG